MEISTSFAFPVALHKKSCTLGIYYRPLFKNKRDVETFQAVGDRKVFKKIGFQIIWISTQFCNKLKYIPKLKPVKLFFM